MPDPEEAGPPDASRPPVVWVAGLAVAFLLPIVVLVLWRSAPTHVPTAPAAVPSPPTTSNPVPPAALPPGPMVAPERRELPESIRELYHRAGLVLERIHPVTPDPADLTALEEFSRQLPPLEAAFGALPTEGREPSKAAARAAKATFDRIAGGISGHADASPELKALTQELVVGLDGFAAGGNRIEDVLSSAYGQAAVALLGVRARSLTEAEAANRLHRCTEQVARLVPAYAAIEDQYRLAVREEAQRQWKVFAPLAAAVASDPGAGERFRVLNAELLSMLREFTR